MRDQHAGLCETCRHVKRLQSSKGSVFYMCGLFETNPAFPRYPQLPVRVCDGFEEEADLPPSKITSR